MDYESGLVIIASKEELNNVGLALGAPKCVRSCTGVSFGARNSILEYGRKFAIDNGYDIVALKGGRESLFGLKFKADLEFYLLSEGD